MSPDYIYNLIKGMNTYQRVNAENFFYGLDSNSAVIFEYELKDSGINIVCPKDLNGDFFLVEINSDSIQYNKILNNGMDYEVLDLTTEEQFFQANTVTDLVLSHDEYNTIHKDFKKYYDGFLNKLTVYLWGKRK